ncbi:hypothetical protein [Marilutibacter spongiae]|uniref:Helix-turn-helix domain-containing protein n=1 Tax=Marilutibacter spongiae TaxID=2025720 RepID=A0A7W3TLA9_9GAMM|nr:hypothetical protein [Lysobacter spongiae]MBB1060398.1 hypothetical protein [Lysobacter spongiae]
MARIRTIKPEFWTSEQVMDLSPSARLLFIGLWNFCDDAGIHPASTKRLKAEIMPADDVRSEDVRRMIDECIGVGLVREYEIDGEPYWAVTGWHHQKIDQPSYKYPNEDGTVPEGPAKRRQASKSKKGSQSDRRTLGERSPPEGKGREGKGEEGKEQSSLRSDSSPPLALSGDPSPPADLKARQASRIKQIAEQAQEAYNRILAKPQGNLPKCTILNRPRLKAVEKAIPTCRQICRDLYGSDRVTPEFWSDYFEEASRDDFHAGRKPGGPGHEGWSPDFEYLLRDGVMAKLFDRAQSEGEAAA